MKKTFKLIQNLLIAIICIVTVANFTTQVEAAYDFRLGFIYVDDYVSDETYYDLVDRYCLIPQNMREHFQLNGGKIYFTDEDLNQKFFNGKYSGVCGVYSYETETVWISNDEYGKDAMVHELGHYLDQAYNYISDTQEVVDMYYAESAAISAYATVNNHEFFAEAFSLYVYDGPRLASDAPRTYELINRLVTSLKGVE